MNNATDVKQVANGRWREVLKAAGLAPELLDGKGHPCPKCGGTDRFAAFKDVSTTGGVLCRQCHPKNNGDGLATVQWLRGCSFPDAVTFVAEYFGLNGHARANGKPEPKPKPRPASNKPAGKTFPTAREAVAALERKHGPRAALWTYRDASGEPVGLVVRWNLPDGKKDIRPVSKHGDGWRIGGMAEPRPLYGLPDLGGATRVYVCEGEKAADAVRSLGLTATTSPHGCESPAKADWGPLAGKEVTILPDNDSPGGKYADAVAALLAKLAPAPVVKLVELPGLPVGGDAVEWIEAHGAAATPESMRAELERLADSAEALAPGPQAAPERFEPPPIDVLPEPVRAFVIAGAKAIGVDPSFTMLPALVVCGAAIGYSRLIQLKQSWVEPALLWGAVVADSGACKSEPLRLAMQPVDEAQQRALEDYDYSCKRYEAELLNYERDAAAWKKGKGVGNPPTKPEKPQPTELYSQDTTWEALVDTLLANPRGVLVYVDELTAWLGSFNQYKAGKSGADEGRWLSSYRAGPVKTNRRSDNRVRYVPNAFVAVMGTIPPGVLRRVMTAERRDSGLMARLLMVAPPRRQKQWSDADVWDEVLTDYSRLIESLRNLPMAGSAESPDPVRLPLLPEAKQCWVEFFNAHAQTQVDATGDLAAALSKLEAVAARLALIIHMVRAATGNADPNSIDEPSMAAGIALARWFIREATRIYELLAEPEEARENRRLVEWIERRGGVATAREVQQCCRWLRAPGLAESALDDLIKAGQGQWHDAPPGPKGGRPTRIFRLSTASTSTQPDSTKDSGGFADVDSVDTPETDPLAAMNAQLAEAATEPDDSEWGTI